MPSLFTRIISGELPGHFVWRDERAVAFLTIRPLRTGHTLVVPRQEIDHWLDLPAEAAAHLMAVSQSVGRGVQKAFNPKKVGVMVVGLEVPHVHVHLCPIWTLQDVNFGRPVPEAPAEGLAASAKELRSALRSLGFAQVSE